MGARYGQLLNAVRSESATHVVAAGRSLIALLSDNPKLVAVTEHPVGFAHAKILEEPDLTIRLHIWPIPAIAPQDPPWLVHRHMWPLTSYVIYGSVVNKLYAVHPHEEGSHRLYSVTYKGGKSIMTATTDRVTCDLESQHEFSVDDRYEVDPAAFHSTCAASGRPTATIAVTGPPTGEPPRVVGALNGRASYRFSRKVIDPLRASVIFHSLRRS